MSPVIDFPAHQRAAAETTLVLLDMQQEHLRMRPAPEVEAAVQNCLMALRHARSQRFQVAFTRWTGPGAFFRPFVVQRDWIDGFTPNRADLVFERDRPSCYSSPWFEDAITQRASRFVLAGFSGEIACLATVIDAFHRHHLVTFLVDASASRQLDSVRAFDVHRVIERVANLFGKIDTTSDWIARTSQSAIMEGKNVEGQF